MTPLDQKLQEYQNPSQYELIIHPHAKHLAVGIYINSVNNNFDLPIDISSEPHNVIDEGEHVFKVIHIPSEICNTLAGFLNKKVVIEINSLGNELYISTDHHAIKLYFVLEPLEEFMPLKIERINELPNNLVNITEGEISELSTLYKIFENTLPMIDNEGNKINQITTRDTAEVGITLSINDSRILICKPDQDMAEIGVIKITTDSEEELDFVLENKLIKSREL